MCIPSGHEILQSRISVPADSAKPLSCSLSFRSQLPYTCLFSFQQSHNGKKSQLRHPRVVQARHRLLADHHRYGVGCSSRLACAGTEYNPCQFSSVPVACRRSAVALHRMALDVDTHTCGFSDPPVRRLWRLSSVRRHSVVRSNTFTPGRYHVEVSISESDRADKLRHRCRHDVQSGSHLQSFFQNVCQEHEYIK